MKARPRKGTNEGQNGSDEILLPNGVRMATRLNQIGRWWLQAQYNKPIAEVWADTDKVTEEDACLACMALVAQANPTMPPAQARQAVVGTSLPGVMFDLLRRGGIGVDTSQSPAPKESIFAKLKRRTRLRRKGH